MVCCGIHGANKNSFVHQHDEEMDELKRARRPGRPASMREDALKVKIAALEKEFQNGFCELTTVGRVQDFGSPKSLTLLTVSSGTRSYFKGQCLCSGTVGGFLVAVEQSQLGAHHRSRRCPARDFPPEQGLDGRTNGPRPFPGTQPCVRRRHRAARMMRAAGSIRSMGDGLRCTEADKTRYQTHDTRHTVPLATNDTQETTPQVAPLHLPPMACLLRNSLYHLAEYSSARCRLHWLTLFWCFWPRIGG